MRLILTRYRFQRLGDSSLSIFACYRGVRYHLLPLEIYAEHYYCLLTLCHVNSALVDVTLHETSIHGFINGELTEGVEFALPSTVDSETGKGVGSRCIVSRSLRPRCEILCMAFSR